MALTPIAWRHTFPVAGEALQPIRDKVVEQMTLAKLAEMVSVISNRQITE
jgi:hypothetical protein